MAHMATIRAKGQLVIPAELRKKCGIEVGTRVSLEAREGQIIVTPNRFDALLALRGILSHVEEDVDTWWAEEKRKERDREEMKIEAER